MFANYCKLASSQSNRHKYRLLQNHRCTKRAQYISIFFAKSEISGVLHWVTCCHSIMEYWYGVYNFMESWSEKNNRMFISNIREYECECLFLIFVHANANSKKTCEYSHLRMRIFGPSLMCTQCVVVWLQHIYVWDFVFMYWLHKEHCHLFPGPEFFSTSPLRSSQATSLPAGGRRLGAKTANVGPPFGRQGEGVVICPHFREGYPNCEQATAFGALCTHPLLHRPHLVLSSALLQSA